MDASASAVLAELGNIFNIKSRVELIAALKAFHGGKDVLLPTSFEVLNI